MTQWTSHQSGVGWLPIIFQEGDPRTAQEQADDRYSHGGGWMPFEGFKLGNSGSSLNLVYEGDRPMNELARANFRDQTLVLFEGSWIGLIEADGTLASVSRMD